MDNNKKERNSQNTVNIDSSILTFMYNGMSVTVSFAPSTEHTVNMEDLVDIFMSNENAREHNIGLR
jgi:hypothetical protein